MSLSKEYNVSLSFPVTYINLPADKVIASNLPESIEFEISADGYSLLEYKFKHARQSVTIDMKDFKSLPTKNQYYFLTNSRIDKMLSQFKNEVSILKISPDTIFLNFNKKVTRRVRVIARLHLNFESQYQQTDSVELTPAFIDISGAADVIGKINFVETVPVTLKNVTRPVSVKLSIQKTPGLKFVELSPDAVHAKVKVAKFTEGSLQLPVEVENLPHGYGLKTFPDKVTIKYNVSFDNYEKISPVEFRASIDYMKIEPGSKKLKIQLVKYPSEIRSIKIIPEKVEYIIRK